MNKFPISGDTSVVTSKYITEDNAPILEVSHQNDEEGGSIWQFHAGNGDYLMTHMQLIRLSTVLRLDPTVNTIADLPLGKTAVRNSLDGEWRIVE